MHYYLTQLIHNNPSHSVYRENKWEKISSEDLVPGDICLIQVSKDVNIIERKAETQSSPFMQQLQERMKE